jgi:hypothetical protein
MPVQTGHHGFKRLLVRLNGQRHGGVAYRNLRDVIPKLLETPVGVPLQRVDFSAQFFLCRIALQIGLRSRLECAA